MSLPDGGLANQRRRDPTGPAPSDGAGQENLVIPTAPDLRAIVTKRQREIEDERQAAAMAALVTKQEQYREFMARKVTDEFRGVVRDRLLTAVKAGVTETIIAQFPCEWCTDRGRMINVLEVGWQATLQGFGREILDFYEAELRQAGYRLNAAIVTFPEGMPGDVGMSLIWGKADSD